MAAAPLRHLRLAALAAAALTAASYDNGSGWRLPVMGWNSWCTDDFCGLLDLCFEAEIHEIADAMNASGMVAAGYRLLEVRKAAGRGRGARFARHTRPRPRPRQRRRPRLAFARAPALSHAVIVPRLLCATTSRTRARASQLDDCESAEATAAPRSVKYPR
jgi:hypothetical protein